MKNPKENKNTKDNFGSGFNPSAIRRSGVVFSIAKHSVRTETAAVKAASKVAVEVLRAVVARGDLPDSVLVAYSEEDIAD